MAAVVILRRMRDNEQQEHVAKIMQHTDEHLIAMEEDVTADELSRAIEDLTSRSSTPAAAVDLAGAEQAARFLLSRLATGKM